MENIFEIEVPTPIPLEGVTDSTYKIEGTVKMFDVVGAPPWVYAEIQKKDWYKPEVLEEVTYERGFPLPISGSFSIEWAPEKAGIYEVTVVATPAPLPLPVIGVAPVIGRSDMMKMTVSEKPAGKFSEVKIIRYELVTA